MTVIAPSCPAGTPRKAICVCGEAKWLPGIGNTYTGGGPLGLGAGVGFLVGGLALAAVAPIRQRRIARTIVAAVEVRVAVG